MTAREILERVANGSMTADEGFAELKAEPFRDLGYAKVDTHRKIRQGYAEVIYGAGKTTAQIAGIAKELFAQGNPVLITRLEKAAAAELSESLPLDYRERARIGLIGDIPKPDGKGVIAICTGGTSDIPMAEEAAVTCEVFGNSVARLYDVGVAGIHRLLSHIDDIMSARVIIAVAGMEGALASVVAGLADCPVIAVPTSVGYGASFGGIAALLSMLNSCAGGVSVVNIDNGFGAAYQASMINHL